MITRRVFIQSTAIIGLASSLPNVIVPRKKKSLGVALVGLGYYSRDLLAPALQLTSHCHLAGIVSGTPSKQKAWQEKYKLNSTNIYDYGNMDEIANNSDIDVIYIVLPTGLHAKYAIKAANSGKHVWCEKPMARTEQECQAIIDACHKNNVKLSIGYRMQHEPNTQKIIAFAKNSKYGQIKTIVAQAGYTENRKNHWKLVKDMGGGAMYDMGVYSLNGARYAAQEEPLAVSAQHYTSRPEMFSEVDETTTFQLEFPSGARAECETSFGKGLNYLKVDAEKGWYELKPFQAYSGIKGRTSDGVKLNASIPNQQAHQMDDDALSIINNTAVLVPGEEGMRDIRIVEAIYKSAAENRRITL